MYACELKIPWPHVPYSACELKTPWLYVPYSAKV